MKKIGLLLLSMSFILFACDSGKEEETGNKNVCDVDLDCDTADMSGYENFDEEDHVFLEINFDEATKLLETDDFSGIIYFGYPTCPWCIEALPIMNEVAKGKEQSIYYVNKRSDINQEHPEWEQAATDILDAAYGLDKDDDGNPRIYVPEVIVVKDGEVVAHHMGTLDEHDATERKMTDDEKAEVKEIYEEMFSKLQ